MIDDSHFGEVLSAIPASIDPTYRTTEEDGSTTGENNKSWSQQKPAVAVKSAVGKEWEK